jgi:uncharacterized membrane protein YecN with MAPEG domain
MMPAGQAKHSGGAKTEGTKMTYSTISSLIFLIVAIAHAWRIYKRWPVTIGPHSISMTVSWVGFVVAALLAMWGSGELG